MTGQNRNWLQEGFAHSQAERWLDAVACYRNALTDNPDIPEAHYSLGFALQALGRRDDAIAAYRNAVVLKADFAQAHNNLGNIYRSLSRLQEAEECYRKALAADPGLTQAHYNLGLVLRGLNRFAEAEDCFRTACALAPDYAEAWKSLRGVLATQGRTEESLQAFLEIEKHAAPSAYLIVNGLMTARQLGDFERERRYLAQALEWAFQPAEIMELSQLIANIQFFDVPPDRIMALYRRYNELAGQLHSPAVPLLPPKRTKGEKIRIGYLSPDFRAHVMGRLMHEVISRHDTAQFEVYLYSLLPSVLEDEMSARFGELAHKFVRLAPWAEQQSAKMIAEDDLDVLVDLAGHSVYSRPLILAYKPARVQITHLGYHGAIGLEAVDYKMTDQYADKPDNQNYLIEKLLPLEGCVFPFPRVAPAAEHPYRRESFGIAADAVVFGEFVALHKLGPRCLAAWRSILERVPNGVLAFSPSNPNDRDSFLRQTGAAGIAPERVVFIPREGSAALNRARYQLVDIVLDTFPYSGGDTTLAALDMGVPVVALCGERHSERTSYSILMHAGLKETIAFSEAEFVEIACKLAGDPPLCEKNRAAIRESVEHSGVVDLDAYTRNLEKAYRRAMDEKGWNSLAQGSLTATELRDLLRQAIGFHQAHQLKDAERLYRKLLDDQPDLPSANYLYAKLLEERGNMTAAIDCLRRVTARYPRFKEAFQALGAACLAQADFAGAIAAFGQALTLQPDQPQGLLGLGQALMLSRREEEGKAVLGHVLNVAAANADLQFEVGVALQQAGILNEAGAVYSRVLVLRPADWQAHFNLGVIHHEQGRAEQAVNHFHQVIGLRLKEGASDPRWGESLLAEGKVEKWMENFCQLGRNV
jgi:predicted O-linked N-acetylglucosamine transferase (SPINDLY family)/thioredoxin-like negative regulator of GroEL